MSVRTVVKSIQNIMRQDTGVDGDAQRISQLCWMFFLKIIDDQDQELELMQDDYTSPIPGEFQWRTWAADPEGITGEELLAFINDDLFPALKTLPVAGRSGDRRRVVRSVFDDAYNYMKSGQLMRPGGQQDQRGRLQQPERTAAFLATSTNRSSMTCNRRAMQASTTRPAP